MTNAINANNSEDRTEAIMGFIATPVMDGLYGLKIAKTIQKANVNTKFAPIEEAKIQSEPT